MVNPVDAPQPMPTQSGLTAPTPVNTPLQSAPIQREALSHPTVATVGEEENEDDAAFLAEAATNPALMNLVQNRLNSLVGRPSGYIEALPQPVRDRLSALQSLQKDFSGIEKRFQQDILDLERKYIAIYAPLYDRRQEIVVGTSEPTEAELKAGKEIEAAEKAEREAAEGDDDDDENQTGTVDEIPNMPADVKGIPSFWLIGLKNHVGFMELITEADEEALTHLTDIRLAYLPESTEQDKTQPGFKLSFHFSENKFFTNKVLTKAYYYQEEVGYSGDFVYDRAEGCSIDWKSTGEGDEAVSLDLTKKTEVKKQRNKTTNRTRVVKKIVQADSFFNFFSPPVPPADDASISEAQAAELTDLDERLEIDYQLGEDLKERIIPRAIDFFTGKALEYEDGLSEDEYDEMDDEDDDDDDDDDDEDNEQASGTANKEDCKQQ